MTTTEPAEAPAETPPPALLATAIDLVALDDLVPHPANPNHGSVEEIGRSVDALGGVFYQVIFAQRSTRRILAGEHRLATLRAKGSTVAPVVWLDVDDDQAFRILIGDNEIPREHSHVDQRALAVALRQLAGDDRGLGGTGHDDESLRAMLGRLADKAPPAEFPDAAALAGHVEHRCPSCGYEWSGSPTPAAPGG